MAFCRNCGAYTPESTRLCASCGADTQGPAADAGYTPPVMPGAPQQSDIRDAQDNKVMAVLAYLVFFIPLLLGAHKTSPFVKFHTNQGTILFIAAAIWGTVYGIVAAILLFIPFVGWAVIGILSFVSLVFPIFCIVGIIHAVNGRMTPLPLIGGINILP